MAQSTSTRLIPKLAIAATTTGTTILACHHLESRRQPLDNNEDGCNASSIPAALTSLQTSGVAIVDNLRLAPSIVDGVRNMPAAEGMPTELLIQPQQRQQPQRRRGPPGANRMPRDETWRLSAYGRYHRLENHLGEEDIRVLEDIERRIWPLVEGFFRNGEEEEEKARKDDDDESTATATNTAKNNNTSDVMDNVYRSELQLMTAVPGSNNQSWHRDNRSRGLSIIVPLVDFSADNGGTQLLLGSHIRKWPLSSAQGARVVHAPRGSIVAYDSRTIHRGLGNDTEEGRPALIFCYDKIESPPPGCGTLGSVATSYQGRIVDILTGAVRSLL